MNPKYDFSQKSFYNRGYIKVFSEHVCCFIMILSTNGHKLVSKYTRVSMNTSRIAQLITICNEYGANTIWTRHQICCIQNRSGPFSNLNCSTSSVCKFIEYCKNDPEINYLYRSDDSTKQLMLLAGKVLSSVLSIKTLKLYNQNI